MYGSLFSLRRVFFLDEPFLETSAYQKNVDSWTKVKGTMKHLKHLIDRMMVINQT